MHASSLTCYVLYTVTLKAMSVLVAAAIIVVDFVTWTQFVSILIHIIAVFTVVIFMWPLLNL